MDPGLSQRGFIRVGFMKVLDVLIGFCQFLDTEGSKSSGIVQYGPGEKRSSHEGPRRFKGLGMKDRRVYQAD